MKESLSEDKELMRFIIETYFADIDIETENEEIKQFIKDTNISIENLKTVLLDKLKNI